MFQKDRRTLEEMEIPAPDVIPAGRPTAWEQKVSAVSEHAIKEEEEPFKRNTESSC